MQRNIRLTVYALSMLCPLSRVGAAATDDAAVRAHIAALHNPRSEVREAAALALRQRAAERGDGTLGLDEYDHNAAYWKARVAQVRPGMSKADAFKLLPILPRSIEPTFPHAMSIGTMDGYLAVLQLDYHWNVSVWIRYAGKDQPAQVMRAPELKRYEVVAYVLPPSDYSGTWVKYYVNGQPATATRYKNGRAVATTEYDANGRKKFPGR